ncbi:hypothetical protein [Streptomyces lydicamycinicus]|uniref:hypothetical protein n=1 Tax=Streptomyces lydicamycinicus TaxID=1546107 RepID=UPI003C2CE301
MDEQNAPSTETDETPEHVPDPAAEGTSTAQEPAAGGPEGEPERDEAGLPDWARTELAGVRKEAAKYRVAAKELREALAQAKSPEDFAAATARVAELETDLHRERLARKYRLPDVLAARVTGETEEAREADAKGLADAFHTRAVGLGRGGLDPSEKTTPKDPAALAGLIPRRRR